MLTSDLAMSFRRGEQIRPRQLNPKDPRQLQTAADLVAIFGAHAERERRELDEALGDYVGTGTDYRTLRGLIKLLNDRCRFETAVSVDPVEIRRAVFLKARGAHPVVGGEEARAAVAAEVAPALGCDAETALASLYADLPAEQRLLEFDPVEPSELIDLYNLAQAQALLYRSVEMRLRVEPQGPDGYRELFGAVKAYRLIHTVKGDAGKGYEIVLSGPVSMFHRSQKYGVQMAVFLPALLLCRGWRMRAEINTKTGPAYFELDSRQTSLRSHYAEVTPYENPAAEKFAESWGRAGCASVLEPSSEVLGLGDAAFIPDFSVTHPSGRLFYLEFLGFWTPEHLRERVSELERQHLRNYLLAAWEDLRGTREPLANVPPNVLVFKKNLDPSIVEFAINRLSAEGA
jgi:uncharacterized protein